MKDQKSEVIKFMLLPLGAFIMAIPFWNGDFLILTDFFKVIEKNTVVKCVGLITLVTVAIGFFALYLLKSNREKFFKTSYICIYLTAIINTIAIFIYSVATMFIKNYRMDNLLFYTLMSYASLRIIYEGLLSINMKQIHRVRLIEVKDKEVWICVKKEMGKGIFYLDLFYY